ncbi:hypothetical protein Tcan_03269 [Toxocara canis]|uniref:Uncharacterized protein n=1 Tax=Toxocara canis TaxID=6265 RepID=A0A0B2VFG9_TOXCA|nr:hypothetical protein Tcan_03269 [Toxocara canis]
MKITAVKGRAEALVPVRSKGNFGQETASGDGENSTREKKRSFSDSRFRGGYRRPQTLMTEEERNSYFDA